MLTRFQSTSALAVRPSTGWTRPGVGSRKLEVGSRKLEVGGRAKSAIAGVKNRVKRFLARPGIQKAMSRVGHGLGTSVGMVKGAAGAVRRKAGFKRVHELAEFRRRRGFRARRLWLCGEERIQEDRRRRR